MTLVTKSEFAKIHKYTMQRVHNLIERKVIEELPTGELNLEECNQRLLSRLNLSKSNEPLIDDDYSEAVQGIASVQTQYIRAKLNNELEKNRLLKMDAAEREHSLIPAEAVKKTLFMKGRVVRDALLNIPDRVSSMLATMTNEREIHDVLTKELRSCLEELTKE